MSSAPLLEVRDVAKHYGKGKKRHEVLTDLNISLNEGEVLGIIGESGCGKSVLLNLISCLMRNTPSPVKTIHERSFVLV